MRIVLDLEPALWWRLAGVAERRDTTVAGFLMTVVEELGTGAHLTRRTAPDREKPHYDRDWLDSAVTEAHRAGLNDSAAAAKVGCSPETVRRVRNRLGLPQLGRRSAA